MQEWGDKCEIKVCFYKTPPVSSFLTHIIVCVRQTLCRFIPFCSLTPLKKHTKKTHSRKSEITTRKVSREENNSLLCVYKELLELEASEMYRAGIISFQNPTQGPDSSGQERFISGI